MVHTKKFFLLVALVLVYGHQLFGLAPACAPEQLIIVGGGMAGAMEAYCAYDEAKIHKTPLCITIFEQNNILDETTICNIVPSLTCDEIIAVVPRGPELVRKLNVLFSKPGGIRVEDVPGIHGTVATEQFKQAAQEYSLDEAGHEQRTQALLALGKMSMDLWKRMYDTADAELKKILELSNFNPCCDSSLTGTTKALHAGYRIDLIYHIANAHAYAEQMKKGYQELGYADCMILTPQQVMTLDPFLSDFCKNNSQENVWNSDAVALWRPGGCIDGKTFLPLLYEYLKKKMGTYINEQGQEEDCFQVKFAKKVTGVMCATNAAGATVVEGLRFADGKELFNDSARCTYVFCPGQSVGTLHTLGFREPAYAGFAGVSLLLDIPIPADKLMAYQAFNHCMEVHQEGVVLAWQARFKDNKIFIGVAGTKAFYSDQLPTKHQDFAVNRNLLQLNMINDVLPEFVSLALGYDTTGKVLTQPELDYLESQGIAKRWAGIRSVVYDGFPTLGYLYKDDARVDNARCTTHLGSGGGSFAPAVVAIGRCAMYGTPDAFAQQILAYGNACRGVK